MHTADTRAISATLAALVARLPPDLGARARESFPPAIAETSRRSPPFRGGFDAAEFYAHVGELEEVDPVAAAVDARAACRVIAENLPPDVVAAMQRQLGPELGPLLVQEVKEEDDRIAETAQEPGPMRARASFVGVIVSIALTAVALVVGVALMIARMR